MSDFYLESETARKSERANLPFVAPSSHHTQGPVIDLYLKPIPGTRLIPTEVQLRQQWNEIETRLMEAVRTRETP